MEWIPSATICMLSIWMCVIAICYGSCVSKKFETFKNARWLKDRKLCQLAQQRGVALLLLEHQPYIAQKTIHSTMLVTYAQMMCNTSIQFLLYFFGDFLFVGYTAVPHQFNRPIFFLNWNLNLKQRQQQQQRQPKSFTKITNNQQNCVCVDTVKP